MKYLLIILLTPSLLFGLDNPIPEESLKKEGKASLNLSEINTEYDNHEMLYTEQHNYKTSRPKYDYKHRYHQSTSKIFYNNPEIEMSGDQTMYPSNIGFTAEVPIGDLSASRKKPDHIEHKGKLYYYQAGNFYVRENNRLKAILPPEGIQVNNIPMGTCAKVSSQFYCDGIFYKQTAGTYKVSPPLSGLKVPYLPIDAKKVRRDDETLYYYNEIFYRPVKHGKTTVYLILNS